MTNATTIRTPKGKKITDRQYFALCGAAFSRNTAQECSSGCLDCAAWHGGPCRWEIADRLRFNYLSALVVRPLDSGKAPR